MGGEMTRDDIIRMAQEAGGRQASYHELYDHLLMSTDALERFSHLAAAAGAKAECKKVAQWMIQRSYATGHGDTTEDLLEELEWQVRESERKAILKQADSLGWVSVDDIRARGEA